MSRWQYSSRIEADNLLKISIAFLRKHGYLCLWRRGKITWTRSSTGIKSAITIESSIYIEKKSVRLIYKQTDKDTNVTKNFDYKIPLTTTKCNYGGNRYWFICPMYTNKKYCGKRVGVLYKAGDYFTCRHCYNLTYQSRNTSGIWRSLNTLFSRDELEEKERNLKRKYYAGKITRRYKRLLTQKERLYSSSHIAELMLQKMKYV